MAPTAGIDLASAEHRLCVIDKHGRQLEQRRIANSEEGLRLLCRRLIELDVARVALERPNGLVVDRLLDAGITVVAVHPKQLAAARERYRTGGGTSDGFDSDVLAELARTGMHRLTTLQPDTDETRALRALTRAREDLVEQRVALANQLRAQLEAFWPGAARLFADIDSTIALAFLERYPSPDDARGLGEKRLAGFHTRNGYSGHKSAAELLQRLRGAPTGRTGELETEARRAAVLGLVAALRPLVAQIRLLTSASRGQLADHPDSAIFRWACNRRLRDAISVLADTSRRHNPWAQRIYQDAIARGKDHPHAIRILGRAWLRIIWRLWHDHTPYDPTRHGSLQRLLTHQG